MAALLAERPEAVPRVVARDGDEERAGRGEEVVQPRVQQRVVDGEIDQVADRADGAELAELLPVAADLSDASRLGLEGSGRGGSRVAAGRSTVEGEGSVSSAARRGNVIGLDARAVGDEARRRRRRRVRGAGRGRLAAEQRAQRAARGLDRSRRPRAASAPSRPRSRRPRRRPRRRRGSAGTRRRSARRSRAHATPRRRAGGRPAVRAGSRAAAQEAAAAPRVLTPSTPSSNRADAAQTSTPPRAARTGRGRCAGRPGLRASARRPRATAPPAPPTGTTSRPRGSSCS